MIGDINIDTIPSVEIKVSEKPAQRVEYDDEKIKFTNITSRTREEFVRNFTVIDVETTGLRPSKDEILEVCAIRFRDGLPKEKFSTLTAPHKKIPPKATKINGISQDMVDGFPHFSFIADSLVEFVGNDNIVGHNLEFDLQFILEHGANVTNKKRRYYDTLTLAKHILTGPKRWDKDLRQYVEDYDCDVLDYKLQTLCDYYHISLQGAHRAHGDCCATGFLFLELADERISPLNYRRKEQPKETPEINSEEIERRKRIISEINKHRKEAETRKENNGVSSTYSFKSNVPEKKPTPFDRLFPPGSIREKLLPPLCGAAALALVLAVLFSAFG